MTFQVTSTLSQLVVFQQKKQLLCSIKYSSKTVNFLRILRSSCLIYGFKVLNSNIILVYLRYYRGTPLIKGFLSHSTPGSKVYIDYNKAIQLGRNWPHISIVSNPRSGLASRFSKFFVERNLYPTGELICSIW